MIVSIKTTARYQYTKNGRQFYLWTWTAAGEDGIIITSSKENPEEVWDREGNMGLRSEWYDDFDAYEAGRKWALDNGYIVREDEDE